MFRNIIIQGKAIMVWAPIGAAQADVIALAQHIAGVTA